MFIQENHTAESVPYPLETSWSEKSSLWRVQVNWILTPHGLPRYSLHIVVPHLTSTSACTRIPYLKCSQRQLFLSELCPKESSSCVKCYRTAEYRLIVRLNLRALYYHWIWWGNHEGSWVNRYSIQTFGDSLHLGDDSVYFTTRTTGHNIVSKCCNLKMIIWWWNCIQVRIDFTIRNAWDKRRSQI